ncbi:hypothetical protein ACFLYP_00830 [Chloroflexota bacterium]
MNRIIVIGLVLILLLAFPIQAGAQEDEELPVVNVVVFVTQDCTVCAQVMTNSIKPLMEEYGEQLNVIAIDVRTGIGSEVYAEVVEYFNLPPEHQEVPTVLMGERLIIGWVDIDELFAGFFTLELKEGGADWLPLPKLIEAVEEHVTEIDEEALATEVAQAQEIAGSSPSSPVAAWLQNNLGFTVLLILAAAVGIFAFRSQKKK